MSGAVVSARGYDHVHPVRSDDLVIIGANDHDIWIASEEEMKDE
jgi:hypothetical protein